MQTFDGAALATLANACGTFGNMGHAGEPDKDSRRQMAEFLRTWEVMLGDIGVSASRATFTQLLRLLESDKVVTGRDIVRLWTDLGDRLADEVRDITFFHLTPREAQFYRSPRRGWELSIDHFPEIIDDVEEASKCFALSRYPASVFHTVQIVEHGLIELGGFLKVSDPHSGWTAVANALAGVIKKSHPQRSRFERKNFGFLEQAQGTVEGLKNAWRNKISHAHGRLKLMSGEFNPEVAEEILLATRAFMRRLAEGLPPSKSGRKGGA